MASAARARRHAGGGKQALTVVRVRDQVHVNFALLVAGRGGDGVVHPLGGHRVRRLERLVALHVVSPPRRGRREVKQRQRRGAERRHHLAGGRKEFVCPPAAMKLTMSAVEAQAHAAEVAQLQKLFGEARRSLENPKSAKLVSSI